MDPTLADPSALSESLRGTRPGPPLCVVGIGASADATAALTEFIAHVPASTDAAYVIVRDLALSDEGRIVELLDARSLLPLLVPVDNQIVQRGCIYLTPPNADMTVSDGRLRLTERDPSEEAQSPADVFFRSMATEYGHRSVVVDLTGGGGGGSRGASEVRDAGGLVIAEPPSSAGSDGVSDSTPAAGAAHALLEPSVMPRYIASASPGGPLSGEARSLSTLGTDDADLPELSLREVRLDRESSRSAAALAPSRSAHAETVYEQLLERYLTAAFLVSGDGQLLHTVGSASDLIAPLSGPASLDLASLVHAPLRTPIRRGLQRAREDRRDITYSRLAVDTATGERTIDVTLSPLGGSHENGPVLVIIEDADPQAVEVSSERRLARDPHDEDLKVSRQNLQVAVDELEATNGELQRSNEELSASNEELQSVNVELHTVNREHHDKIEELTQLADDTEDLLRSTEIGTVLLDSEMRVRRFTHSAADLFNLLDHDVGRPIVHMSRNFEVDDLAGRLTMVVESERLDEVEVQHVDGRWFLLRLSPYRRAEGHVDGVVITAINLAKMHSVAGTFARRDADLQGFAYGTSHDLQEPIRSLTNLARLVVAGVPDDAVDNINAYVTAMEYSSVRLKRMLDAMLVYSRVETRAGASSKLPIRSLLEAVVDRLAGEIARSQSTIEWTDDLPDVWGDRTQVESVLHELVSNSIRFTSGPAHVTIAGGGHAHGLVHVDVVDNGVGIPPDQRESVFRMFKQLSPDESHDGIGAGLAISRRIAERMGGSLTVVASGLKGSTLRLTLPSDNPAPYSSPLNDER